MFETFSPPPHGTLAPILEGITAALIACERHEPHTPAAAAFRSAIRRRGEEALAAGGTETLAYLRRLIIRDAPDHAEARERILIEAWSNLSHGDRR